MDFNEHVKYGVLYCHCAVNVSELVSFLQNRTDVTKLSLHRAEIGNEGAKALANLTNLTTLDLKYNNIGNEGAKALASLTNLTKLELSDNNIGDEGAKALASLTNPTKLDLKYNNIGDEGAKALASLTNLTKLELSDNNIGDEGANELANLIHCGIGFKRHPKLQIKSKNNNKYYVCGGIAIGLFLGLSIAYLAGAATLTPVGAVAVFLVAAVIGALVGYGVGKFCERVSEEKQEDPDIGTCDAVKSVLSSVWTTGHNKSPVYS
ncbi:hypothetical protein [Wolbachia endosymbiont (group A) of Urophora cardui]|uniref:hypothetical protein n=1 Tax=Wolbachia endosymbiont (group A) of Urophora cardui TaxID=3066156 RepID=UPI00333FBD05